VASVSKDATFIAGLSLTIITAMVLAI